MLNQAGLLWATRDIWSGDKLTMASSKDLHLGPSKSNTSSSSHLANDGEVAAAAAAEIPGAVAESKPKPSGHPLTVCAVGLVALDLTVPNTVSLKSIFGQKSN